MLGSIHSEGVSPHIAEAMQAPQGRKARRIVAQAAGRRSGYHKPRSKTGRPTFPPTEAELYRKHVAKGGCDVRTKKGTLCQIRPAKGKSTCKVHTGKPASDG